MSGGSQKWKTEKKVLVCAAILVVGGLVFGAFRLANSAVNFPMADVKRKEFVDYLEIKGEVKAIRSAVIAAPYGAGDLQILRLVDNATKVKKGDFLVEFDATTVKQKLAEDQSAVKSAEAEMQQSRAASRLKEEQDVTDAMTAKYDTEKARMDASKQEILSVIEGEQAKLKLADAEQKQKETEAKLKADRAAAVSDLASKQQKHDQAAFQVELDERALESLTLRAPLDGVVALQNHWQPQGSPTTFKPGDRAWPGAAIAELPDGSALKIVARVEEAERGQLKAGAIRHGAARCASGSQLRRACGHDQPNGQHGFRCRMANPAKFCGGTGLGGERCAAHAWDGGNGSYRGGARARWNC